MTKPTVQERVFLADVAVKEILKKYRVKFVANSRGEYWLAPTEEPDVRKPDLRLISDD